jgi:hypothetical protein
MKLLLAAAAMLLVSAAHATVPCQLTDQDYTAIKSSPSGLDKQTIATLPADRAQILCNTRTFAKKVMASNGNIQQAENYSPYYLTPNENKTIGAAVDAAIQRALAGAGVVIA